MSEIKIKQSITNLEKALNALKKALNEPEDNELTVDGTIQRFEFSIELFWKTLKRILEFEGIEATSPRMVMKHAFAQGWLEDEKAWLKMWDDRCETSHVYDENKAREIYYDIKKYHNELFKTLNIIKAKYN